VTAYLTFPLSRNLGRTVEDYLIAKDVAVSRTATIEPLLYGERELDLGTGDELVRVWRSRDSLFNPASMSSLEGKAVVHPHPSKFLSAADTAGLARGHCQNVRPGAERLSNDEWPLLADLVIFDPVLAAGIEDGSIRQVSPGYQCRYEPLENDDWEQVNLMYNHLALVATGRSGELVAVQDGASGDNMSGEDPKKLTPQQLIERIRQVGRSADRGLPERIVEEAELVQELMMSGVGPGSFAAALAKVNPAYATFAVQSQRGADYEAECKKAGEELQRRFQHCTDCRPVRARRH
jgi:hypothetical protein